MGQQFEERPSNFVPSDANGRESSVHPNQNVQTAGAENGRNAGGTAPMSSSNIGSAPQYMPNGQPVPPPYRVPGCPPQQSQYMPNGQPVPPPYRAPACPPPTPTKQPIRPMAFIGELICLALGILCFFAQGYASAVEAVGILFGIAGIVVLFVTHRREERISACGIAGLMISLISSGMLLYELLEYLIRYGTL